MPRLVRSDAPGVLHHVMGRGIDRRKIFLSDTDCNDFTHRLAALAKAEYRDWLRRINRSMGGWSAVLAIRRRGERRVADQRILDDGDFVSQVILSLDDLVKKNLRLSGRQIDIKALAEKVSERYNVSIGELRSGGRRRSVVKARRAMSWIGVRELGYSGADVARYLSVTNACVTRMISAGREGDSDDINSNL